MRTFDKLGNMTKLQTVTAERVTAEICKNILKHDLSGGGHMDLELKPAGPVWGDDARRMVEIRRGQITYSVEIRVRREQE